VVARLAQLAASIEVGELEERGGEAPVAVPATA